MRPSLYLLAAALAAPSAAFAAPAQPLPSEVRLSDSEKEKILEEAAAAAANRRQPAVAAIQDDPLPPQIHGEVGFSIGTGGYRSAYGTAVVPLAGNGQAIISLGTTDFGNRYDRAYWER